MHKLRNNAVAAAEIRQSILAACVIWQPSYALQERYLNVQTYLGLKDYHSIVPQSIYPTTSTEDPQISGDDTAPIERYRSN